MKQTTINRIHKEQLAELFDVSQDYVSKVIRGKRSHKGIRDAYEILVATEEKGYESAKKKISRKIQKAA